MFCVKERILVYYPSVFAQFRHRHLCQRFCQHAFAWRLEDMFTRTYAENWYFNFTNSISIQIRRPTCFWRPNFYWFNNQHISTYILISIPVNILVKWKDRYISVTCTSSQSSSSSSSTFFQIPQKEKSALAGRCRECEFLMWGSFNLLIWPGLGACLLIWKPNLCLGALHGLLQRCGQRKNCICALQYRYTAT